MYSSRDCRRSRRARLTGLGAVLAGLLALVGVGGPAAPAAPRGRVQERRVQVPRSVPAPAALRQAQPLGRLAPATPVRLALVLPLRDPAGLEDLIRRLYDPMDPLYGRYLTPPQFAARFSPTQADYDAVTAWAKAQGLAVVGTYANRTLLDVTAPSATVEAAVGVHLNRYRMPDGRVAYANDAPAALPASVAARLVGIVGLNNLALPHANLQRRRPGSLRLPAAIGTGALGFYSPSDIKTAYNLADLPYDGTGQALGLLELDGYNPADITAFLTQYKINVTPKLQNILLDGFNGVPQDFGQQDEVESDIEMMLGLAPNATIYIYETTNDLINNPSGYVDLFARVALDNLAKSISTSWLNGEDVTGASEYQSENQSLQQMAAQGQSFFAAAGDTGAYGDPADSSLLIPTDPASQPYATGVGGTKLTTASPGGAWSAETSWNEGAGDAGGGGISTIWPIPSYQQTSGVITAASKGSTTNRNVPDVSLNADPQTGYDVYVPDPASATGAPSFATIGGTSLAAPLWAAYIGLVNQQRAKLNLSPTTVGFLNPQVYTIGLGANYGTDFHDIADNSTNLFYPAVKGFDDSTGWGTFIGDKLIDDLAANPQPGGPAGELDVTVTDATAQQTPIANATITVRSASTGALITQQSANTNGVYVLSVPSQINYLVTADAPNYAGQTQSGVSVTASAKTSLAFHLAQGHAFAQGLQMISAPYEYNGVADFATLFGVASPPASTDPVLFAWDPILLAYVKSPQAPADTLHLGQGYWGNFPAANYLHRTGIPAAASQPYRIVLQSGWNMIGDPFLTDVAVSSIQAADLNNGAPQPLGTSPLVRLPLYGFNATAFAAGSYPYTQVTTAGSLSAWLGYWVFANHACTLVMAPPVTPPPTPGTGSGR